MTEPSGSPSQRFRKKPVVIDALQWTGENLREIIDFSGLHPSAQKWTWQEYEEVVRRDGLKIFSLEGPHLASIGDWIIKGVKGEFYACKPDIFATTYEPEFARSEIGAQTNAAAQDAGFSPGEVPATAPLPHPVAAAPSDYKRETPRTLSKDEIEEVRRVWGPKLWAMNALCDMALQNLERELNAATWELNERRGLDAARERDRISAVEALRAARSATGETLTPLERYALTVLEAHREDIGDLDGGFLQDKAEECGLLYYVEVKEPCGDFCRCAEYDGFPQQCLRLKPEFEPKMATLRSGATDSGSDK